MSLIFFLSAQPDLSSGLGVWDLVFRRRAGSVHQPEGDQQDELAPGRDALGVRLLLADRGMFGIGQRHGCHDTSESSTANYRRSGAGWLLNRPPRRLEATVTRCISRSYMG